jgi:hypothetical protein
MVTLYLHDKLGSISPVHGLDADVAVDTFKRYQGADAKREGVLACWIVDENHNVILGRAPDGWEPAATGAH